ncbi:MAG: hypothetical protein IJJ26_03620 [Victivallales bacterium]|nr:hypothetical protein [Victivallales bacterium]
MAGLLEQAFLMGLGTLAVTKNTAEKLVNDALSQEKITPAEGNAFLKTVEEEGAKTKQALDEAVNNALKTSGKSLLPGYKEIQELQERVAALEAKVAALEGKPAEK